MVLILLSLLAFQHPAFEVASVKTAPPETRMINTMLTYPGGRIVCQGCWLQYLIMEAFDIHPHQISGGPGWINDDRFNVEARPPADSRTSLTNPAIAKLPMNDEQREMLQTLLMDRFLLKYHFEEHEGIVYFLVKTNKKLKLEPTKNKDEYPWAGTPRTGAFGPTGIAGVNITMVQLSRRLSQALERPVIDRTGLEGAYDFRYEVTPDDVNADRTASILMSVQALGLKLEGGKGAVQTMVIDHAEKPSAN